MNASTGFFLSRDASCNDVLLSMNYKNSFTFDRHKGRSFGILMSKRSSAAHHIQVNTFLKLEYYLGPIFSTRTEIDRWIGIDRGHKIIPEVKANRRKWIIS